MKKIICFLALVILFTFHGKSKISEPHVPDWMYCHPGCDEECCCVMGGIKQSGVDSILYVSCAGIFVYRVSDHLLVRYDGMVFGQMILVAETGSSGEFLGQFIGARRMAVEYADSPEDANRWFKNWYKTWTENIKESDEDFIYQFIEISSQFPGGWNALSEWLANNVEYPVEAQEKGVQGSVLVRVVIERDGSFSNIELFQGLGYGCDEEAIRVVKNMPNWIPARQCNKIVRSAFIIPVKFGVE